MCELIIFQKDYSYYYFDYIVRQLRILYLNEEIKGKTKPLIREHRYKAKASNYRRRD